MDDTRVGSAFRSLRVRRGWRQQDLAAHAGVSQSAISEIELGRFGGTTLDRIRLVAKALDMRVEMVARWRGGELDRLLNTRHASLASAVAAFLRGMGWEVAPEVSFAIYGERGWIDILAWHAPTRTILVIEIKTELVDVHETLGVLDRKSRLAGQIARERGWMPLNVGSWLVMAEGSTNRHHVARFAPLLRTALPDGAAQMRQWLRNPTGRVAALTFFSNTAATGIGQATAARRRVRVANRARLERGASRKPA